MEFRGRRLYLARDFGARRIDRLSGTKNRIPRSRHFSQRRDATARQKSEIISRGNWAPDSVHFSWRRGVDGNWLPPWPSPLPSFSLLLLRFFAPPTSSSRFCCPADSSNLRTTPLAAALDYSRELSVTDWFRGKIGKIKRFGSVDLVFRKNIRIIILVDDRCRQSRSVFIINCLSSGRLNIRDIHVKTVWRTFHFLNIFRNNNMSLVDM